MKKRNEEGYVLVYVMVVVFVLCAIALALMSGTLHTLQTQEAMVQRMKDKYEAMGEIERVVAEIGTFKYSNNTTDDPVTSEFPSHSCEVDHDEICFSKFLEHISKLEISDVIQIQYDDAHPTMLYITVTPDNDTVNINATINITASHSDMCNTDSSGIDPVTLLYTHTVHHDYSYSITDINFVSYEIASADSSPENGGDPA